MPFSSAYHVAEHQEGNRLDKILGEIMPDAGLRHRRRLCDEGMVLIGGREAKAGYKVRAGQVITIKENSPVKTASEVGVHVVAQSSSFGAVYKPGGVHSAALEGKDGDSVERLLPELFPEASPVLLNRLDCLTSGLLVVALDEQGVGEYQRLEDAGEIRKFYLAEIKGRLDGLVTIRNRLDTDDRKTTRVQDEDDTDSRRWTDVEVLSHDHDKDTTLVRCLIMKGARHQIRVHLSNIGHPIVGDPLYGDGGDGDRLRLHHQRIECPGFTAEVEAPF